MNADQKKRLKALEAVAAAADDLRQWRAALEQTPLGGRSDMYPLTPHGRLFAALEVLDACGAAPKAEAAAPRAVTRRLRVYHLHNIGGTKEGLIAAYNKSDAARAGGVPVSEVGEHNTHRAADMALQCPGQLFVTLLYIHGRMPRETEKVWQGYGQRLPGYDATPPAGAPASP